MLGRSRGGCTTKGHRKTNPEVTPRPILTGKGDDAESNRVAARARGIVPVIPVRKRMAHSPKYFPQTLYEGRARIGLGQSAPRT